MVVQLSRVEEITPVHFTTRTSQIYIYLTDSRTGTYLFGRAHTFNSSSYLEGNTTFDPQFFNINILGTFNSTTFQVISSGSVNFNRNTTGLGFSGLSLQNTNLVNHPTGSLQISSDNLDT